MTQEEKQLLLKDICTRLPYGIKVRLEGKPRIVFGVQETLIIVRARREKGGWGLDEYDIEEWNIKPYLRPMSSMTEEEYKEFCKISGLRKKEEGNYFSNHLPEWGNSIITERVMVRTIDWLNTHHFDYRGIISMGLALEAPKDMYQKP